MTDEKTRALIEKARAVTEKMALHVDAQGDAAVIDEVLDALSALTVPDGDMRERLIQIALAHVPILGVAGTGKIVGCRCMDRVFVRGQETWAEHIADAILAAFPALSRAAVPDAATDGIPLYGMLDVWMALYGTSHSEFDEFYAEHGYAETWAKLLDSVRRLRTAGLLGGDPTEDASGGDCRGYCEEDGTMPCEEPIGGFMCTRSVGHEGVHVACSADEHDLTGALTAAAGVAPQAHANAVDTSSERVNSGPDSSHVAPQETSAPVMTQRERALLRKMNAAEERAQELFERYAEHAEHVQVEAWSMDCVDGNCEHRDEDGRPEDLSACPSGPMEVCVDCMEIAGVGRDPKYWEEGLASWPCENAAPPADESVLNARSESVEWHFGRSFEGTRLEDGCPCVKAPCGLVTHAAAEKANCPDHSVAAAKTIRQSHPASSCPALAAPPDREKLIAEAETMSLYWRDRGETRTADLIDALAVPPVVDETKLAEVISRHKLIHVSVSRKSAYCRCDSSVKAGTDDNLAWFDQHRARAVAEWLRGGER